MAQRYKSLPSTGKYVELELVDCLPNNVDKTLAIKAPCFT